MPLISVGFFVFHFEISSKDDDNNEHPSNIEIIFVTLLIFHFEILVKYNNDEHS